MLRFSALFDDKLYVDVLCCFRHLTGTYWIDKESLEQKLLETIVDPQYENFVAALERLVAHPYSYRVKDFIMTYKKQLVAQTKTAEIPAPQYDTDGRAYITTYGENFWERYYWVTGKFAIQTKKSSESPTNYINM